MSEAVLLFNSTASSSTFFLFLAVVPFYYEARLAIQGLGWFESHFILGYPSKLFLSQANARYWHLCPHAVFLVPLMLYIQWWGMTYSKKSYGGVVHFYWSWTIIGGLRWDKQKSVHKVEDFTSHHQIDFQGGWWYTFPLGPGWMDPTTRVTIGMWTMWTLTDGRKRKLHTNCGSRF